MGLPAHLPDQAERAHVLPVLVDEIEASLTAVRRVGDSPAGGHVNEGGPQGVLAFVIDEHLISSVVVFKWVRHVGSLFLLLLFERRREKSADPRKRGRLGHELVTTLDFVHVDLSADVGPPGLGRRLFAGAVGGGREQVRIFPKTSRRVVTMLERVLNLEERERALRFRFPTFMNHLLSLMGFSATYSDTILHVLRPMLDLSMDARESLPWDSQRESGSTWRTPAIWPWSR